MPNWVWTRLQVEGSEQDVRNFMAKASKPYMTYYKGEFKENEDGTRSYDADKIVEQEHTGVLSFWNFKKPENEQAYFGASDYKPEGYDKLSTEEQMAISMKFKSDGWYDWNIREWGTKWDASDPQIMSEEEHGDKFVVAYNFNTAWSPAVGAFEAMVEQHPELQFEINCVEEQGWGVSFESGTTETEDGKTVGSLIVTEEWDIPESHKEWEDIGESCRQCAWHEDGEDTDDLYDDCPAKQTASTEQAIEAFEDISELI